MSFINLELIQPLLQAISEKGYDTPTPIQKEAIPLLLTKQNIICKAPTGTGKTAAYALAILQQLNTTKTITKGKKTRALVLTPTRELAIQTHTEIKKYAAYTAIKCTAIYGGTSIAPQKEILKKGVDIVIATPGRLLDLHKQNAINLDYVAHLVIDEADVLLEMGFVDTVKKIERICKQKTQTILLSATFPHKVEQFVKTILPDQNYTMVNIAPATKQKVQQHLYYTPKRHKIALLQHLLRTTIKGNVLIFRRTKFGVSKLEEKLQSKGYKAITIHGNKSQNQRIKALNDFKKGRATILIATDVAARGIDIIDLDNVINFDIPNIPETYLHRIGRVGRADQTGNAIALCAAEEKNYITTIEKFIASKIPVVFEHPFILHPEEKPILHTSNKKKSKYKKGRKSAASKKKKKRWY